MSMILKTILKIIKMIIMVIVFFTYPFALFVEYLDELISRIKYGKFKYVYESYNFPQYFDNDYSSDKVVVLRQINHGVIYSLYHFGKVKSYHLVRECGRYYFSKGWMIKNHETIDLDECYKEYVNNEYE
ncbi:hypothetical protein [uncultured Arcobacter sp.]|uniref:hypothetical protein n=1 Tax=uncultured Arcobacter sp. TaxID=165434 RepID=UPI0026100EC3|nr:hypothetical protein [uncultured Arcobacter sp.]